MNEPLDVVPSIKKKLIHDVVPCGRADEFMRSMELIPGSPEGEEVEHRASHRRLNRIAPVNESILLIAGLAGEVVGRCILEDQGIDPDEDTINQYQKVASVSAQTVIANLLEMDLLHIGGHS